MTDELFGSWLEETRKLQAEAYGTDIWSLEGQAQRDYILEMAYALEDEVHEVTGEYNWKSWSKNPPGFKDRDAYIGEIIDVLHFAANLLVAARCTREELNEHYHEKANRNRKRMAEGYTGDEKCIWCKRAKDDILAHGGKIYEWMDGKTFVCDSCGA